MGKLQSRNHESPKREHANIFSSPCRCHFRGWALPMNNLWYYACSLQDKQKCTTFKHKQPNLTNIFFLLLMSNIHGLRLQGSDPCVEMVCGSYHWCRAPGTDPAGFEGENANIRFIQDVCHGTVCMQIYEETYAPYLSLSVCHYEITLTPCCFSILILSFLSSSYEYPWCICCTSPSSLTHRNFFSYPSCN